ncbi:hypothetical protein ACP70R_018669 [Stipagrostis hirtigluma subsp. patula]
MTQPDDETGRRADVRSVSLPPTASASLGASTSSRASSSTSPALRPTTSARRASPSATTWLGAAAARRAASTSSGGCSLGPFVASRATSPPFSRIRFLPPFSRGVHELSGGIDLRQIVQSGRAELRGLDGPRTAWSVPGERRIAYNLPVTIDEGHRVGSGRRGPRGLLDVLYDNFDRAHDGRVIAAALPVVVEADACPGWWTQRTHRRR